MGLTSGVACCLLGYGTRSVGGRLEDKSRSSAGIASLLICPVKPGAQTRRLSFDPDVDIASKVKGSPQSKSTLSPPMSENTLLAGEARRVSKLAIWNETRPLGTPEAPLLVAERFRVAAGQYQAESGNAQSGRVIAEGEGKNNPLLPVSMNPARLLPLKDVMKLPDPWPHRPLPGGTSLERVPIPSTR